MDFTRWSRGERHSTPQYPPPLAPPGAQSDAPRVRYQRAKCHQGICRSPGQQPKSKRGPATNKCQFPQKTPSGKERKNTKTSKANITKNLTNVQQVSMLPAGQLLFSRGQIKAPGVSPPPQASDTGVPSQRMVPHNAASRVPSLFPVSQRYLSATAPRRSPWLFPRNEHGYSHTSYIACFSRCG